MNASLEAGHVAPHNQVGVAAGPGIPRRAMAVICADVANASYGTDLHFLPGETEAALLGFANPRKAALLRGKSMPPAKCASRRVDDRRRGDYRCGNAVNTRFAIVKSSRNVTETGGGNYR
jgi:hypothetical protein